MSPDVVEHEQMGNVAVSVDTLHYTTGTKGKAKSQIFICLTR